MRIVDMRQEMIRQKGLHVLSRKLRDAIEARLAKKEQVILFLNRRGYATHMFCPKCGYVAECPNCSVKLTYHRKAEKLSCHLCGDIRPAPKVCPAPDCRDPAIRYAGMGTEKVEAAVQAAFPTARVQRMDSDTMTKKTLYREIFKDFRVGKIDILVLNASVRTERPLARARTRQELMEEGFSGSRRRMAVASASVTVPSWASGDG